MSTSTNPPKSVIRKSRASSQPSATVVVSDRPVPLATYEQVKAARSNKKVFIIDVRYTFELQEYGTFPGSINIPLDHFKEVMKNTTQIEFKKTYGRDKPTFDSEIIMVCRAGRRSLEALRIANRLGYNNVMNYPGGWLEYAELSADKKEL